MSDESKNKINHDSFMADLFWKDMVAEAKVYLINKHLVNGDLKITKDGINFTKKDEIDDNGTTIFGSGNPMLKVYPNTTNTKIETYAGNTVESVNDLKNDIATLVNNGIVPDDIEKRGYNNE